MSETPTRPDTAPAAEPEAGEGRLAAGYGSTPKRTLGRNPEARLLRGAMAKGAPAPRAPKRKQEPKGYGHKKRAAEAATAHGGRKRESGPKDPSTT